MSITRCENCNAVLRSSMSACISCGAVNKAADAVRKDLPSDALQRAALHSAIRHGFGAGISSGEATHMRKARESRGAHNISTGEPRTRIMVGDVAAGEFGRIMTEHDLGSDVLFLHGLAVYPCRGEG